MSDRESDGASKELRNQSGSEGASQQIDLATSTTLDLSTLTPDQQNQIAVKANEAKLDLAKKAAEAQIDTAALNEDLTNLNQQARDATREGVSFTGTFTTSNSTGRTEVVMGNTERAASGKISRAGQGLPDNTVKLGIIGAVVIATVAIAIVLSGA